MLKKSKENCIPQILRRKYCALDQKADEYKGMNLCSSIQLHFSFCLELHRNLGKSGKVLVCVSFSSHQQLGG